MKAINYYLKNEKEKDVYIKEIKKEIQELKKEDSLFFLKKMSNIVKKKVQSYSSDFYFEDIQFIKELLDEHLKNESFFMWIVRRSGTHITYNKKDSIGENSFFYLNYYKKYIETVKELEVQVYIISIKKNKFKKINSYQEALHYLEGKKVL